MTLLRYSLRAFPLAKGKESCLSGKSKNANGGNEKEEASQLWREIWLIATQFSVAVGIVACPLFGRGLGTKINWDRLEATSK